MDLKIFPFKTDFRLRKGPFKAGFTVYRDVQYSGQWRVEVSDWYSQNESVDFRQIS
jgi:hypothetical protein